MTFRNPMENALIEARAAGARGETPVGAVIYDPAADKIISADGNRVRELRDPTAHAECLAIRAACEALTNERLQGLDLYVTLEPCPMCAGIISASRVSRLYYGASDPKSGGVEQGPRVFSHSQAHHKPEIYSGICENEAAELLRDFFAARRKAK